MSILCQSKFGRFSLTNGKINVFDVDKNGKVKRMTKKEVEKLKKQNKFG